jgi:multidrug efflux pump subunit AcrB
LISRFFIDRPIFASVLSIVITLAGGIALIFLPIAMYPPISPPVVQVDCSYPGASAQVVAQTVATPIEQQVNGVENMLYMSSQCTNDGAYNLTVTFKHGVDLNMAQVLVQNRVSLAVPLLPDVIKQTGVTTRKKAPDILLALALTSPEKTRSQLYLSNYALMSVKDEIARLPGVSDIGVLGQRDYSIRIWIDPEKLASRDMTAADVADSIRRQNMQVASGQIGQPPIARGQEIQIPLATKGRLVEPEEFAQIIIKKSADGRIVRLKDVAKVELGAKNEDITGSVNGRPAVSLAIFQLPDANALDTAVIVKAKIEELKKDFPRDVDYEIRYDTTPFISESIAEVFKTLREAIILVAVVVLLFLQNWRSALIPLIAVPVAIIGTFAVMAAMGFSLNNLTLFGLVLAIGIVVDDAIVVVEAVEHHVEHGMAPRDATVRAMDEVSGPVIAIGLVLTAVFVPCAFISGIVGQFFRQFALTIATSTVISAFNSLTLSPALAAILIKPKDPRVRPRALPSLAYAVGGALAGFLMVAPFLLGESWEEMESRLDGRLEFLVPLANGDWAGGLIESHPSLKIRLLIQVGSVVATGALGWVLGWPVDRFLVWFFGLFNAGFRMATRGYSFIVSLFLRGSVAALVLYGGLLYLTYDLFGKTPAGFIPTQDMGYLLANVQLTDSVSLERTKATNDLCEQIARDTPGIRFTQAVTGQSLLLSANGSNFGSMFCIFDPFDMRHAPNIDGSDLLLIPAATDRGVLPIEGPEPRGEGKKPNEKRVVLADINHLLNIRIFNRDGRIIVDTNEVKLKGTPKDSVAINKDIESLKKELGVVRKEIQDRKKSLGIVDWLGYTISYAPAVKKVDAALYKLWVTEAGLLENLTKNEKSSTMAVAIEALKKQIESDWPRTDLSKREKAEVVAAVKSMIGTIHLEGETIIADIRQRFAKEVREATITVLGPPPVRGVGRAGGFKLMVEDRGDNSLSTLQGQTDNLVDKARLSPKLTSMVATFRANVPQYFVDVNRAEVMTKDVSLQNLFDTLRIYLGSLYVNDFNRFGRTWQVIVQADPKFRNTIEYVPRLKVRNTQGTMVPVGTLASLKQINGPLVLTRYNMYPAAPINGAAAAGTSSGDAISTLEALGRQELLTSMTTEWTELAYLELQAGNTAMYVFGFAVIMVFLVLAAQYESWSLPLAIIMVVPMCLLSAVIGVRIAGEDINIFTQIGFVVLVGLASKNAILIVEFAKQRRDLGDTRREATMKACTLRLRPIIMTSVAFILGVLPLLTGHGAGAEMRRTLGTTVFSGMLGVTLFGIFLTPTFFFVIDWLGETRLFSSLRMRRGGRFALLALIYIVFPPLLLIYLFQVLSRRNRGKGELKPAPIPVVATEMDSDPNTVAVGDREGELVEVEVRP